MSANEVPAEDLALRAALVKRARELVGAGVYAEGMGVADRTARAWSAEGGDPGRPVTDRILRETRELLIGHRQNVTALIQGIRAMLGEGEDRG